MSSRAAPKTIKHFFLLHLQILLLRNVPSRPLMLTLLILDRLSGEFEIFHSSMVLTSI